MPFPALSHGRRSPNGGLDDWVEGGPWALLYTWCSLTQSLKIKFSESLCLGVVYWVIFYDSHDRSDWLVTFERVFSDSFTGTRDQMKAIIPSQCDEASETPRKGGDF
ncbi:MAG: hypothetical protein JNL58_30715 [Planctomyces sp.]|nr:hypothetical protein [Planctomyces sp.]